ncbi:PP0621 family protein [Phytopseudomonas dryadis]|uniref:MYND finger n=1 Tax=Phytopseudomonas dryadis TaxID=2487520 RepID=A0A4Q9R3D3_9GAMM|nr:MULTISPECIES: PP0621 family protein [Pseudomonas]TBU92961.1 hypothetical protein DNK44_11345 [Pseudomonas dryadis]TBV04705.1 hypothetical protein DNK34_14250 [Pseudomonas dryadis]TBV17208.1 hypothetical protein DNK41_12830 [Pseudomonas sp. FRB 230]
MGLLRLLFWIAIILAAIWVWRRFFGKPRRRPADPSDAPAPMVRCAQCGVHTPRQHALNHGERWYCSQAHLEQGPKAGDR